MKRNQSERKSFVFRITLMTITALIGSFYLKKPQLRDASVMKKENDAGKSFTAVTIPMESHEETSLSSILVNHKEASSSDHSVKTISNDESDHKTSRIRIVTKTIIDKPAWNEEVADGEDYICSYCGEQFKTVNELKNHCGSIHNASGSYRTVSRYRTVHHDAITHQETVCDEEPSGN